MHAAAHVHTAGRPRRDGHGGDRISRGPRDTDGDRARRNRVGRDRQHRGRARRTYHGAGHGDLIAAGPRVERLGSRMRIFNDLSDLKAAVGTEVGVSDWIEITQDRINKFAEATGDEQWIHVDVKRAAQEAPGGTTIAHGLLSLSLIPMFIRSIIGVKGLRNTLNYGANRIRYLTPVPAGSRLRGRVTVMAAEDVPPDALRVTYKVSIEIEGGTRPACVAEVIGQHYR